MTGAMVSESGREGSGMGAVSGAPGLAGGNFNGPLMPQPATAPIATVTANPATKRRNIRSVMRLHIIIVILAASLARCRGVAG